MPKDFNPTRSLDRVKSSWFSGRLMLCLGSNSHAQSPSNFMPSTGPQSNSSLRDNRAHRGTVGEFLKSEIQPGSHLSFVSAYLNELPTVESIKKLESTARKALKKPQS